MESNGRGGQTLQGWKSQSEYHPGKGGRRGKRALASIPKESPTFRFLFRRATFLQGLALRCRGIRAILGLLGQMQW